MKVGYKYRGREGFGCSLCSEDVVHDFHSEGQNFTNIADDQNFTIARAMARASPATAPMPPVAPTSSKLF